jgi:uncharacterized protein (DUF1330 family)
MVEWLHWISLPLNPVYKSKPRGSVWKWGDPMAKGYWLAQVDVTNPDGYKAYVVANQIPFRKYGGRFVVRAGHNEVVEGAFRSRLVVIEFPDYETALACYRSPEYQHAISLRKDHATADLAVVEGYDGPQPGEG